MSSIDPQAVLAKLTLEEKVQLTAGSDLWRTTAISRLGVPYLKLSDGPSGARGGGDFNDATPSTLFPSPSCLGSTWDVALAHEMGRFIGLDAIEKQCHVILGPTINIQRDPRAGRFFESYSEDPTLTGHLGCAWVRGAQSTGVAATMKHFVGNEAETERRLSSSDVSQEALREVYLEPFRMIMAGCARAGDGKQFGAQPLCAMTSYNRINGLDGSENTFTINEVLRNEWGFRGLVMSDWHALHAHSLQATDLEMPGPTLFRRAPDVVDLIKKGDKGSKALEADVDRSVLKLLELIKSVAPLGFTDRPEDEQEESVPVDEVSPAIRRIAAEGAVIFKNEDEILPLQLTKGMRIACIGAPWIDAVQSGGGSANLTPQKVMEPLATLKAAIQQAGFSPNDVQISHHRGCSINNFVRILDAPMKCEYFSGRKPGQGDFIDTQMVDKATLSTMAAKPKGVRPNDYWIRATIDVPPAATNLTYRFGLICLGSIRAHVSIQDSDEKETVWDYQGETMLFEYVLNPRRKWQPFCLPVRVGQAVRVIVDYLPELLHDQYLDSLMSGLQVGLEEVEDEEALVKAAAQLAAEADVAVVLTALGKDWESEGFDRPDIRLPRQQDHLVDAVTNALPNRTVVLNLTGSVVEMPWRDRAAAIVQCWYGGQEGAEALVDVLLARGDAPASGRLAHSWPARIEHHPSGTDRAHFPGVPGKLGPHVQYAEGRLVGYRYYNRHADGAQPVYPFGHGLGGFTTFRTEGPTLESGQVKDITITKDRLPLKISVSSTNTGKRTGKEVAQIYVRPKRKLVIDDEPVQRLATFATLRPAPGHTASVALELHQEAFSVWDEKAKSWQVLEGTYDVVLAHSARLGDELGSITVQITEPWSWTGLGLN